MLEQRYPGDGYIIGCSGVHGLELSRLGDIL